MTDFDSSVVNVAPIRDIAVKQIQFAREYTQSLLADIADEDWFRIPSGISTHIAWQVGHLAMAQYGLCLFRQRGRSEVDKDLMPSSFRKAFARGSEPSPDQTIYPSIADIRQTFAKVHEQMLIEAPRFSAESLNEPVDMPYAATPTKLGALLFCPLHEMVHAGQIGLLRRHMGKAPVR